MVQNITMAQALAVRRRERVDANAELIGLGAANVVAAFYGGMPVGGGLSRSAVNVAAGAQTPLASIVAGVAMLAIVAAGTHWFARLPLAVLAASIVIAALGMIDVKARFARPGRMTAPMRWRRLVACAKRAAARAGAGDRAGHRAVAGDLAGAPVPRISPSSAASPAASIFAISSGTASKHLACCCCGSTRASFGNLAAVESRLAIELEKAAETRDVVLIMSGVNRVDTTAMETLCDINSDLINRSIRLHLAEVKGPVQDRLVNSPLWRSLSGEVYLSVNAAYEALMKR